MGLFSSRGGNAGYLITWNAGLKSGWSVRQCGDPLLFYQDQPPCESPQYPEIRLSVNRKHLYDRGPMGFAASQQNLSLCLSQILPLGPVYQPIEFTLVVKVTGHKFSCSNV